VKAWTCLLCGLVSASLPARAATMVTDTSPLLELHVQLCGLGSPPTCQALNRAVWIAKDGTLVAASASLPAADQPWSGELVSGRGSAAQLAELRQALAAHAVGQPHEPCFVQDPNVDDALREITWYGRGQRSSYFLVTAFDPLSHGPPPCPPDVVAILGAIEAYLEAVVQGGARAAAAGAASTVVDRSPLLGVHFQAGCGSDAPPTCQGLNRDVWIAKDGTMVAGTATIPAAGQPWSGQLVSGKGSAAQFSRLVQALVNDEVGHRGSACVPLVNPNGYLGLQRISWFGRGRRWNVFDLDFGLPSPYNLLPFCSDQDYAIVDAIETYRREVVKGGGR
jgi:hypothetical protein